MSREQPGVHHPSLSFTPEDSFSLPSIYDCNPAGTKILRRWCVASSYHRDGMSNDVSQLIYHGTLLEGPDPITEVSMGSTMACYKYTHRGFSTLNNTPTHIIAQLHKYTACVQMSMCLDGFGRLCGHHWNLIVMPTSPSFLSFWSKGRDFVSCWDALENK